MPRLRAAECSFFSGRTRRGGFTLVELLVVIAIIALLASLLFPALARAKGQSQRAACFSNLRQIGVATSLYLSDARDRFPDRRDLKQSLGYRPWTSWPPSDPRVGWAFVAFSDYLPGSKIWSCPALAASPLRDMPQIAQTTGINQTPVTVRYWMWRFDHFDDPVLLDNFWGKSVERCLSDLRLANNPQVGLPKGPSEVELVVDPYFPITAAAAPPEVRGRAVHPEGRNRLQLDLSVGFIRDSRLM